jgi:hypothetical protein
LVNVSAKLVDQTGDYIQPALLACDVQCCVSIIIKLVNVGAKLIHEASYHMHIALVRSDAQG